MSVDDPAVILKWFFLGLIYLFFFSILRATWSGSTTRVALQKVESRKNKGVARADLLPDTSSPRRSTVMPDRLVVLEPEELIGTEYILRDELSIGRSSSCHISLQDVFISQLHARVMLEAGDVIVEDLGSTNGTYVNRDRLNGSVKIGAGDRVQVGGIVMELR